MNLRSKPAIAILIAIVLTFGDYWVFAAHYFGEFDGVVVSREDLHFGYLLQATKYVIQEADGHNYSYVADPSEGGGFGFPVGTHLAKQAWHLDYQQDGVTRNDFPLPIYFFWLAFNSILMFALIVISILMRIRDRKADIYDTMMRGQAKLTQDDSNW